MKVSVVGFPGLALAKLDQEKATVALHSAFDRGVNFFDVAPAYGNGDAEIKMGIGLQGLDRAGYYLACKTKKRDKSGAQAELDRSLQRLKTDHFDLYQLHHLVRPAEVTDACGAEGAIEMALKAKQEGKIRFWLFGAYHQGRAAGAEVVPVRHSDVPDQLRGVLPAGFQQGSDGAGGRAGSRGDIHQTDFVGQVAEGRHANARMVV